MREDVRKTHERKIFDLIYGGRKCHEITDHENPDFLVRLLSDSSIFGVEVTEYFSSETHARLDRIDGYAADLLNGADFRHKEDRATLRVSTVDVIRPDDSIAGKNVPAIIHPVPPPSESARQIGKRIGEKAESLRRSTATVSHTNLIVLDNSGVLRQASKQHFCEMYFTSELLDAIVAAPFREIFLVTRLKDGQVYAQLKMLYLLAELYSFNGAIVENGLGDRIPKGTEDAELFGAYLRSTVGTPVFLREDAVGKEVIFGDSGVLIGADNSVTIRLHSDFLFHANTRVPTLDWQAILGLGFRDIMTHYRKSHIFRTEAIFAVHGSPA